jgi:hypothetical protein
LLILSVFFSVQCEKKPCTLNENYPVSAYNDKWPFLTYYPSNFQDTIMARDNHGNNYNCIRNKTKSTGWNNKDCPSYNYEQMELGYGLTPRINEIGLVFNYQTDKFNNILEVGRLPIDSLDGALNLVYAHYNLNNLNFIEYLGTYRSHDIPNTERSSTVNLQDTVTSLGKTYYKVYRFNFVLPSVPGYDKGYKNIWFDPKYGMVKFELNDGTIVEMGS